MAREAPEDKWAGLAPQERLMHGAPRCSISTTAREARAETLKARALAAEDAARAVPGVTNSEGGARRKPLGDGDRDQPRLHRRLCPDRPRRVGERARRHGARWSATMRITARAMPRCSRPPRRSGGWPASGRWRGSIPPRCRAARCRWCSIAASRRGCSGICSARSAGSAITRKTSFLLDCLGKQIFAKGVTICDDPHRPRGLRSRPFDGEGLPVLPIKLVDDGMLETWLLDSASARQLGLEPTGHAARGIGGAPGVAPSNLYMQPGNIPPETLVGEIERGILVTELIGQGVNGVTGDYSRGAAGFLIENGEITRAVSEITIAGNLKDMFLALTPANDLEFRYGINAPTSASTG
jgi:PmbA protein